VNSIAAGPGLQQQIPAAEYTALVDLYTSTEGQNRLLRDGWNNPAAENWEGVGVSGFNYDPVTGQVLSVGSVFDLRLENNGLNGFIPASVGNLVNLRGLRFGGNQLGWNDSGRSRHSPEAGLA
jgi:hypothetical protein